MAVKRAKLKRGSSINKGRPPLSKTQRHLSSRATRSLIRSHHVLEKSHQQALKDEDHEKAQAILSQISSSGGLSKYQLASTQGQSIERGGDSSRILVEWLRPVLTRAQAGGERLRLLEVGCLNVNNFCSRISCLDVRRIDLHSQHPGIEEVDFMDLEVPPAGEKLHLISLSLVLNYVPDPAGRGAMMSRLSEFLEAARVSDDLLPCVFLVLPLACVNNSRYFNEQRLSDIMHALGFRVSKQKTSSRLHYSLWTYDVEHVKASSFYFGKEELRPGASRNNFCVTLCGGARDMLTHPKRTKNRT